MAGAQGHAIYGRSEGSSPTGADHRATYLYSADPEDPDHDAVIRIGGEAPKRRVHSPLRPESHASARRAATSDRHWAPLPRVHDPNAIDAVHFTASMPFAGAEPTLRRRRSDARFP